MHRYFFLLILLLLFLKEVICQIVCTECVRCHTKPVGNIPCFHFCHKDQIPVFSQAVSSCNRYGVLYVSDEYLILCRTRFKRGWKAPDPTLTMFCYNLSPDPLALFKKGVSENQLAPLMCVTMGSGMM